VGEYLAKYGTNEQRIKAQNEQAAKDAAEGKFWGSGVYRVGPTAKAPDDAGENAVIAPGTYVAHDVSDCYWERQRSDGSTIANDFVPQAARVSVTVRSSDYALSIKGGCGQWQKQ
jgi:hypothetical protein